MTVTTKPVTPPKENPMPTEPSAAYKTARAALDDYAHDPYYAGVPLNTDRAAALVIAALRNRGLLPADEAGTR